MKLSLFESIGVRASAERLFEFTNSVAGLTTFVGFGPIPGIREARYHNSTGAQLGARREITKTNGAVHEEEIIAFEPPARHVARIYVPSRALSWPIREAIDEFRFVEHGVETRVERVFEMTLVSSVAWPVAMIARSLMRRAVRRDLANLKRRIEATTT